MKICFTMLLSIWISNSFSQNKIQIRTDDNFNVSYYMKFGKDTLWSSEQGIINISKAQKDKYQNSLFKIYFIQNMLFKIYKKPLILNQEQQLSLLLEKSPYILKRY
ncbi:hypothetical protein [Pedobacter mendelii]|uniref:hypothetical protein n=1 Tax=Pedobacter mendelii TaxID=1908240 RepID=UPI0016651365|nr:hypothetical protein [Pedobacter mendelii]